MNPGAILLAGLVATVGLIASLSVGLTEMNLPRRPEQAIRFRGDDGAALSRLAERRLGIGADPRQLAAARVEARAALLRSPLEAGAMRALGSAAAREGRLDDADRFMAAASRRTLRHTRTQLWHVYRGLQLGDAARIALAADTVLRRRPAESDGLFPILLHLVQSEPATGGPVAERLALGPPWRSGFIDWAAEDGPTPLIAYRLLSGLRATDRPPTDREMAAYLRRLIKDDQHQAAYVAWAQHLPRDRRRRFDLVYDGGFDRAPGIAPFDWTTGSDPALMVEIGAPLGGGQALFVETMGGGAATAVEQMLVLPPGRYRLTGRSLTETGIEPERLVMQVACIRDARTRGVLLGATSPGAESLDWRPIAVDFTVPPQCPAQRLAVLSRPGDTVQPLAVWFDDLAVRHVASAEEPDA